MGERIVVVGNGATWQHTNQRDPTGSVCESGQDAGQLVVSDQALLQYTHSPLVKST